MSGKSSIIQSYYALKPYSVITNNLSEERQNSKVCRQYMTVFHKENIKNTNRCNNLKSISFKIILLT